MFKIAKPFFIKCETPLHAGSGTELGIVDMPIQREKHTSYPKIEGSTVKGCMRAEFNNRVDKKQDNDKNTNPIDLAFGPDKSDGHAGALGFTDARLLLFPIKSMKGIFAWITCKSVLERFEKDLILCGESIENLDLRYITNKEGICTTTSNSSAEIKSSNTSATSKIALEEYTFDVDKHNCDRIADFIGKYIGEYERLKEKLVVLSDDDFKDFVNLSTEVITRTKINPDSGTVKNGALFTEEYLPCETIMYSLTLAAPIFNSQKGRFEVENTEINKEYLEAEKVIKFFQDNKPEVMQIGGNETIGKGIVTIIMKKEDDDKQCQK
ncbi:type III-B CRISPR module RAMP protein Cmr4 [Clostridium botulinum]|uniref:type III-B CRISPR module RAMP protein Cmr4 n=1 Tax=Clostridium botulinum TaxID=1491 RepID=UPI0013F7D223|nr:type III-B CRISPR module RAMP protein Cmr4 [Clostridium botulinum]MBN1070991.1 type III-B CRISPR module RAMP protein Cmr4 [Clostridium botulinum]NFO13624.1 type III-B CRISPR module RAMP protein Cmr4 [Clostridium botulinum]